MGMARGSTLVGGWLIGLPLVGYRAYRGAPHDRAQVGIQDVWPVFLPVASLLGTTALLALWKRKDMWFVVRACALGLFGRIVVVQIPGVTLPVRGAAVGVVVLLVLVLNAAAVYGAWQSVVRGGRRAEPRVHRT